MFLFIYLFKARARITPGLRKILPMGGVVLSFPPSSFDNFYQNRTENTPTSTTKQSGPGWEGVPGNHKTQKIYVKQKIGNMKIYKNVNANN